MRPLLIVLLLTAACPPAFASGPFVERFDRSFPMVREGWGNSPVPDNGTMHVNGTWLSPYCQDAPPAGHIALANVTWPATEERAVSLTIHAGVCDGAEIASNAGWSFDGGKRFPYGRTGTGYGYYEAVMRTAHAVSDGKRGGCNSFFIRGAQGDRGDLQNPEIDFEFLTNEPWNAPGSTHGTVHLSATGISGDAISRPYDLPFDPSAAYHRYGFLWSPGHVTFYVDGAQLADYELADLTLPTYGMIVMANNWTGRSSWGGLPPPQDQSASYREIVYRAGLHE